MTNEQPINYKIKYENYKKQYNNNDIIGTINIKGTKVNYLFVQSDDNEYYLDHSIDKEYIKTGSIFLDYRVNVNNSKQLNIYANNSSKTNSPFKTLLNYQNNDFTTNNNYITLETSDGIYNYKIYAVKNTKTNEHMKVVFEDDNDYIEHIRIMRENTLYDNGDIIESNNQILILQTSLLDSYENYLLIFAKRV